jgi:Co/Zn/Cd efflux system component
VAVACTLIVAKAIAWWLSGSVSMLAGLTDSALDGVTSLLNLLAVHYALRPPMTITVTAMARPNRWPAWRRRCSSAAVRC